MNIFKNFRKEELRKSSNNDQIRQFKQIMSFAEFGSTDPKNIRKLKERVAFLKYIISVLREDLKYSLIAQVMYTYDVIDLKGKFIPVCKDADGNEVNIQDNFTNRERNMLLADDCLIGIPWVQERIWHLAVNLLKAPFVQDSNQQGIYFPELDLCFVFSGNHSIAVGSIYKKGSIRVKECSLEPAFKHLKTDGSSWINIHTEEMIEPVKDFRIAAMFEIAKEIHSLNDYLESRSNRPITKHKRKFDNKYEISTIENIALARKELSNNIYIAAKVEGVNVSLYDCRTILNGTNVPGATLEDIIIILNINEAWRYLLFSISDLVDINYVCKVNDFVVRNRKENWDIPETLKVEVLRNRFDILKSMFDDVEMKLEDIFDPSFSPTDQALEFFIYCIHSEPFWKANISTGLLIANKILIGSGAGLLYFSEHKKDQLHRNLEDFNRTGDNSRLKTYLYENCIKGLE